MIKKSLFFLIIFVYFLINTSTILAAEIGDFGACQPGIDTCTNPDFACKPVPQIFGKYECSQSKNLNFYAQCIPGVDTCRPDKENKIDYRCEKDPFGKFSCQPHKTQPTDVFGQIKPPEALIPFLQKDPTGAGGISLFLSNAVKLIYSLAGIVLVFMIIWGAFEWMTSGGDKERLANAQRKIINALIGILLFAIAFAVIKVLGQFTGFTFFK